MHCKHKTCPEVRHLEVSSPDPWSPKKKVILIFSQVNSSGSTRSISLSFLHSAGQLLHWVRFRVGKAKFGAENGAELENGVPGSHCLGRRWLLLAGLSIMYHKEMILGTVKHPLQWHMWKGCYSGRVETASLNPGKYLHEAGEAALHWGWGATHTALKPWKEFLLQNNHVYHGSSLQTVPLSRWRQTFLPGMQGIRCSLTLRKGNILFAERQRLGHHLVLAGSCQLKCWVWAWTSNRNGPEQRQNYCWCHS